MSQGTPRLTRLQWGLEKAAAPVNSQDLRVEQASSSVSPRHERPLQDLLNDGGWCYTSEMGSL